MHSFGNAPNVMHAKNAHCLAIMQPFQLVPTSMITTSANLIAANA